MIILVHALELQGKGGSGVPQLHFPNWIRCWDVVTVAALTAKIDAKEIYARDGSAYGMTKLVCDTAARRSAATSDSMSSHTGDGRRPGGRSCGFAA